MLELESGWLLRSVRLGATIDERENHFGGIYFNRFFELGRRAIRISHTNGDVLAVWCLSVSQAIHKHGNLMGTSGTNERLGSRWKGFLNL